MNDDVLDMAWIHFETLLNFMEQGGGVMGALFFLSCVCAFIFFEKCMLLIQIKSKVCPRKVRFIQYHDVPMNWHDRILFQAYTDQLQCMIFRRLSLMKSMIRIFPLLGLLGTVIGMIQIFDQLAISEQWAGDELMKGISQATLPCFVGITLSVLGIFSYSRLHRACERKFNALMQENSSAISSEK